ncbi:uncharacterized protein HMPREF1541_02745 [Cyphellophora europaea CBS 101466]|uniref:NmrA-like domain-containing protein n=1 Tax=Cyphellophora europaea (strain CBS 101466) TaxID=1220924 RepID=W2S4F5_CYPE1|nr:uncharacterized protein HMPREF1541_02745 [Cyphellophora europaea CBS 101466]ETN43586.1 hypothetical protein HMPREF1541_02745 [Cyphellophora europaea CBS 101466]
MSITKIALIGATGNIGHPILQALLNDGSYEVTILSRQGSTSTDSLPTHPRQKITKVDFDDLNSLTAALQGIEGVVSNVAGHALLSQKKIVDAAVAAGVQRFLPSEFGSDLTVAVSAAVPFNQPKVEVRDYLELKAKEQPGFSYTSVCCGPFLDWCLKVGLFGDLKTREMTLWDGGETRVTTTTLASVGKAVAAIFKNLEATKNRTVRIADTTVTQKQLLGILEELDGKKWTTKQGSTAEAYRAGLEEWKRPQPNMQVAIVNQLMRIIFSEEHSPDYADKLDNKVLGLPVMTEEQVKEVVKGCL